MTDQVRRAIGQYVSFWQLDKIYIPHAVRIVKIRLDGLRNATRLGLIVVTFPTISNVYVGFREEQLFTALLAF